MAAKKLVKNFLMLILFCTEIEHIKGVQADNVAENTPDTHIIYDQRQSGKYNIHVVIKDVAIIEMDQNQIADQNYSDEEYYYDEEDLTVKPLFIKSTSTTSVKPLEILATDKTTTLPSIETTTPSFEGANISQTIINPHLSVNLSEPSVEELDNNKTTDLISLLTAHRPAIDTKSRSKVEPIYAIEDKVLQHKHHMEDLNITLPVEEAPPKDSSSLARTNSKSYTNSKIFKVKIHRAPQSSQIMRQKERCQSNQYRDGRSNCHGKRSSSGTILKRLFGMLLTLPFRQDAQKIED